MLPTRCLSFTVASQPLSIELLGEIAPVRRRSAHQCWCPRSWTNFCRGWNQEGSEILRVLFGVGSNHQISPNKISFYKASKVSNIRTIVNNSYPYCSSRSNPLTTLWNVVRARRNSCLIFKAFKVHVHLVGQYRQLSTIPLGLAHLKCFNEVFLQIPSSTPSSKAPWQIRSTSRSFSTRIPGTDTTFRLKRDIRCKV